MINSLKALALFALVRPKVCNYGTWPKQKRLKLPSTTFRISDEHKSVFTNQLTAFKKPHQVRSGTKQLEFDSNCQYYSILDIRPDATIQSIRSSYFRLAKKFHPDAFPVERSADADQQFAKLTEAYEVLSDPMMRREYDKFLLKTEKPKTTAEVSSKMAILLSNDILSELSKTTKLVPKMETTTVVSAPTAAIRATNAAVRAPNANARAPKVEHMEPEVEIMVPFMQAITGQIHHANLRLSSSCPSCKQNNRRGCITCRGTGHIPVEKVVPIRIPWAVEDGKILTVKHPVEGKDKLKIRVKIDHHPFYVRDKLDILATTKIPWLVGLLGGEITVKNVYGEIIPVSIRPGTDSHTTIRLTGKGVKSTDATGDHLVIVKIIMPEKLSEQQKRILLQFF